MEKLLSLFILSTIVFAFILAGPQIIGKTADAIVSAGTSSSMQEVDEAPKNADEAEKSNQDEVTKEDSDSVEEENREEKSNNDDSESVIDWLFGSDEEEDEKQLVNENE